MPACDTLVGGLLGGGASGLVKLFFITPTPLGYNAGGEPAPPLVQPPTPELGLRLHRLLIPAIEVSSYYATRQPAAPEPLFVLSYINSAKSFVAMTTSADCTQKKRLAAVDEVELCFKVRLAVPTL